MLTRPIFRPDFTVRLVEPESVLLLSESGHFLLSGRLYQHLARLIDGARTGGNLVETLGQLFPLAEVSEALDLLDRQGYLVETDPSLLSGVATYGTIVGGATGVAASTLQTSRVSVTSHCRDASAGPLLAEALASVGLAVASAGPTGLAVVLVDDYLDPSLADDNARALASGRPWLLVKPTGRTIWIGPLFRPTTGCWQCLAQRLEGNRPVELFAQRHATETPVVGTPSHLPTMLRLAVNLAATEVARARAGKERGRLDGRLLTFDLGSLELRWHALVRRPQCAACGAPTVPDAVLAPLILESGPRLSEGELGHPDASASATLQRYEHHVSPLTGIVPIIQRTSPSDDPVVHTYASSYAGRIPPSTIAELRESLRTSCTGKGATDLEARVSGLAEAIERYCGVFQGDELRRRATVGQLGGRAIHPAHCLLFSERQYAEREVWNARGLRFNGVPLPFDEERTIDWTPLWSLSRQESVYLPTAVCYHDYPSPPAEAFGRADSNGCAAGNSREEAILQGLLEVVERDSAAIWWYNRLRRPAIDLDTIDDPYVYAVRHAYRARGRDVWVLDLTSDLGIPVVAAGSQRIDSATSQILLGLGAHLDPGVAVRRALVEMNQMLSAVSPAPGSGVRREDNHEPELVGWLQTVALADALYLAPNPSAPAKRLADLSNLTQGVPSDEIGVCQRILEDHGHELLVLDQTRPDVGMPVVKVVVPGLRHFWARLAPGRLYDVPVRLGWLSEPLAEDALNPIPITM